MKRINVLLMVLVVAVLATSTFVNKIGGSDAASAGIYNSWWFVLLMALVGVGALVAIFRERMWRVPYRLLVYSSVVLILLGGGLTTWTGSHGSMTLQQGVPCSTFANEDGKEWTLPFALTLDRFEVVSYPGSHAPMDFVSHISTGSEKAVISMNHIYKHGGYRFYQEDYDAEGNSTLSVAHDPIGIAVTYAGYLLLVVGLIAMFLSPKSHFRKLLKGVPVVLLLLSCNMVSAKPMTLPRQTADQLGRVHVLYKGRVCPLQTLAKDFTTKLYGNATYQGFTPEQVLSGWMFYFSEWCDEPMIKIKGSELRQQLGMEGHYTSFNNLQAHEDLLGSHSSTKEFASANEKKNLVQMVMNSKLLKIYPLTDSLGTLGWYSQNDPLPIDVDDDVYIFVRKQLGYCQELVVRGDYSTLDTVFAKTCQFQQKQAGEVLPSTARIRAERLYNALTTGRWLAMLSVMLGILSFALMIWTTGRREDDSMLSAVNYRVSWALVALLTCFLLLIIVLRWVAGGHVPMAGGFDSMNLMSVTLGIVALSMARHYRAAPSVALLAMGFCQLVAMISGSNPPITHLMPVLNSPLLTLHVTVIMIAYALFFFVMLSGMAALFLPARRKRLERSNLLMLYPAVALLAVGIVIGAVWANISWGNYWSWDPKEVWALITLIVYLYPLYLARKENHSEFGFHLYCVLAILSVAITYFGVNLLLGGLHSYN